METKLTELTDEQRISKLYDMMNKNPSNPNIVKALLSACVNSISDAAGKYELYTKKSDLAFICGQDIYKCCIQQVANANTEDIKRQFLQITKDCLLFLSHRYFDSFLLYLEFDRKPEQRFYAPRKRQLAPIVQGYQDCADGKCDLLTVSMPKRLGKSQLGSVLFPIWRAGFFPEKSILLVGQGDQLVKSFYQGMLEIIQDKNTYNYWDVFPNCILTATNAEEKTIDFNNKKRFSTITCRSIDGKLTGATEASSFLSIDDPVSGYEEAQNYDRLDMLWNKIRGDVLGRRKEGVPIISIGTRFSLHDPHGHLQEIAPRMGWRTKIVEVPALDPITDTSNFNYKYGLGFSTSYYRHERTLVNPGQWAAEFQQKPIELSGAIFAKDSLQYYIELPTGEPDAIIAVSDPALQGKDFTSMPVAYIFGQDVYIEDVVYSSALPEFTVPEMAQKCVKHRVSIAQVEANNQGLIIAEHLGEQVKLLGGFTSVRTKLTTANKQTKILTQSDYIKQHFFFKSESQYEPGSEYAAFMRALCGYSQLQKGGFDDAPDSLAQMAIFIEGMLGNKVVAFKRPF